jgi:hypothetical protein
MPIKKGLFFTILLSVALSSFAQDMSNRYIFIDGTADREDHLDFFKSNLAMEAVSLGYIVTHSRSEAPHTLHFNVTPDYSDPYYEQYVVTISLYRNQDNAQLVSFDFLFASIDEMYSYTRLLFLNATTSIPLPSLAEEKNEWKNKWLYVRASFDYPIVFYELQPTGLISGAGLYKPGPVGSMDISSPLDHIIRPMPGATLGAEGQVLNFLSVEANLQLSLGDTRNNKFVNTALGLELKGIVKFKQIMLVPYGAFSYTLNVSPVFTEFPRFAAGGGIQFCARAGRHGSLFIDAKYMHSLGGDSVMRNPWLDIPDELKQRYPEPSVIHYKRSHIGIGIGYKHGFFDRR